MAKSIIVYAVPSGKTRFAQRIADHFDLMIEPYGRGIVDQYSIYFTSKDKIVGAHAPYARSFQSVADEINATISLTDWQSGPPPMVGEWNASPNRDDRERRWWSGKWWSTWWYPQSSPSRRDALAGESSVITDHFIKWRGLSAEPIKVTE